MVVVSAQEDGFKPVFEVSSDGAPSASPEGKSQLIFSGLPVAIKAISFGDAGAGTMQGPRHTVRGRLLAAKAVTDLF